MDRLLRHAKQGLNEVNYFTGASLMTSTILHVRTSPLGEHSVSRAIGDQVLQRAPGQATVHTLDLAAHPLPHWTPAWAGSAEAQARIDELLAADELILEVPMHNFGIPSTLKAWIDTVAAAGRTFHYTTNGPEGHLTRLQVTIVSSRGGIYSSGPMAGMDFQETYLRQILGFLGVSADRIQVVRAEGVAMGEQTKADALALAHRHAQSWTPALRAA
jgi:FMN-dependent NADH-azoreductase